MPRTTASARKSASKTAATARQVALVVPHAAAEAGPSFESAMEVLDHGLCVHKLWQSDQAVSPQVASPAPAKRRAKSST